MPEKKTESSSGSGSAASFGSMEAQDSSAQPLEQLLRENLELTRHILEQTQKTRRYIMFGQVISVVKIVLIVGPIIIAFLYLPPLIKSMLGTYSDLLGNGTGQAILEGNSLLDSIFGTTSLTK